ncbi:MAG: hypothetical protein ABIH34_05825 [Nanoarchaeota archaeon]
MALGNQYTDSSRSLSDRLNNVSPISSHPDYRSPAGKSRAPRRNRSSSLADRLLHQDSPETGGPISNPNMTFFEAGVEKAYSGVKKAAKYAAVGGASFALGGIDAILTGGAFVAGDLLVAMKTKEMPTLKKLRTSFFTGAVMGVFLANVYQHFILKPALDSWQGYAARAVRGAAAVPMFNAAFLPSEYIMDQPAERMFSEPGKVVKEAFDYTGEKIVDSTLQAYKWIGPALPLTWFSLIPDAAIVPANAALSTLYKVAISQPEKKAEEEPMRQAA